MVVRLANGESVCRISAVNGSLPLGVEGAERSEADEVQPPQRRYLVAMITAIAWPTPHHRLRRSLSSRRSLLVSASANYRHPPCLIITPNHTPVAADSAAGRRACAARPKGKYSRERMALAPIRARRIFPAAGHKTAVPPSSFISLTFTSHTGSLLLSSLKKVTSPLVPSFLPLVTPSQPARPRTYRACAPWSGR